MKLRLTFSFSLCLLTLSFICAGDPPDRYPDIRKILEAVETVSVKVPVLNDRARSAELLGRLYARAGYLDAAARAYRRTTTLPVQLWKARIVYGDWLTAEKEAAAVNEPNDRATAQLYMADTLWRIGDPENAKKCLEEGRQSNTHSTDPTRRTQLAALLEQTATYLNDPPPSPLSSTPHPPNKSETPPSTLPPFPITPEGFGTHTSAGGATQTNADSDLLTELYSRIAAHDEPGLFKLVNTAATPFQKTLALASMEHLLLQRGDPKLADSLAATMPEADPECVLAKAEALNSIGAAWLRKGEIEKARTDFDSARKLVESAAGLTLGQIRVAVEIAEAQAKQASLSALSEETLNWATQAALQLPVFNPASRSEAPPPPVRPHYRDEAYKEILTACIQTDHLTLARRVSDLWENLGNSSGIGVVDVWFKTGWPTEAIAFAARIQNEKERVGTQLFLCGKLLDDAGAPNI